jgi:trk system potassium uptake protein TrkA
MSHQKEHMNIVIIGAGDVGLHLATVFSEFDYGIILIDNDPLKIAHATKDLDVVAKVGSGSDWELLEETLEMKPDLLIAVTNDDETNLVCCTIGKHLGFPQTIARVRNTKYLQQNRLHFERLFSVDYLISPEKLTSDALCHMIALPDSIYVESFAHGAVEMRTLKIPSTWNKGHIPLKNRDDLDLPAAVMVALIRRVQNSTEQLIFPHGDDTLQAGDEVTFIGETSAIQNISPFLGLSNEKPQAVAIVGGSLVAINLAKQLHEYGIRVLIIEKDEKKCLFLASELPFATILHHNGTDYRFLLTEKICDANVFVAATRSDEANFLAAAAARDLGAEHVIISLSDVNYIPLLNRLGITQAVSPRIHAANRIFSIVRESQVASMISLYNSKAEVMEVKVSMDSKIAGIPIKYLGPELPKDFLIGVIQSCGRIFVADGNRVLSPGDTVIIITNPRHLEEMRKLF